MSKKQFSWLLAITLVVAAVLMLLPGKTGRESTLEAVTLVPGLDARVNEIARVRVVRGGNEPVATLVRGDNGWQVEEAGLYPADWPKLKSLLAALARARIIEPKTSNPDYFDRLGVAGVEQENSSAVLLELGEGADEIGLLIGNSARERNGQYVRFEGQDQALLIDQTLEVARETRDWLERDILDLAESEVVEVDIVHPDGEQVRIRKASADDTDFALLDIPAGRAIQSVWSVNALGGSLSGLRLEDVRPQSEVDWSQAVQLRALTADGVEVNAELAAADDATWLRVSAAVYPDESPADRDATAENEGGGPESSMQQATSQRVGEINRRTSGWAYSVPEFKSQLMNKRMDDLLAAREKD